MKGKSAPTSPFPGETGNALLIVLIFLMLGSLTLVPTLSHLATTLKTGRLYEDHSRELYTADSGIEDGLWRIKFDFLGGDYHPYDFATAFPYATDSFNGASANFSIMNIWFPSDVTPDSLGLTPDQLKAIIESGKLNVMGTAGSSPGQPYRIKIEYTPDTGDNLSVKSLGVWLPHGFTYAGICTLMDDENAPYYPDEVTVAEVPGGSTVVWRYDPPYPLFTDFPGVDPQTIPMVLEFSFGYNPPPEHPDWLPLAVGWITTNMEVGALGYANPNDVPVSWDVDTRFYRIVSRSGDTAVEAYSSRTELRQLGDAISGDYVAIGNSLLSDNNGDRIRETWNTPSSFNLTSIPQNADALYAFLYWAGWRNEAAKVNVLNEDCAGFSRWTRNQSDESRTAVPTGDGNRRGSWDAAPYWSKVDETTPNDGDYITGVDISSGYAYQLFTFPTFAIPAGSVISGVTVYVRAKDASSGTNDIRPAIKVRGSYYYPSSGNNPTTSWANYSYSWTTNPATGAAWTAEDINGTGASPLEQFGLYSSDLEPDVQVSMVYIQVNYC
ncbi:MAG: hypothetical protein N2506_06530, partial [Dehalococcoidales bacterium]|nr:hypothetical protein [Dehalococcoidales bacterium]